MSTFTICYDKKYKCPTCDRLFAYEECCLHEWKCPYCKTYILIAAPDLEEGYTIIRKSAIELKESDIVLLSGSTKLYTILGAKRKNNEEVYVFIEQYKRIILRNNDYLNVIIGRCFDEISNNNI